MKSATVANAINASLHKIFQGDDRVYLIGEDILDPYGGAFGISQGLSSRWPDRVMATPISEAGIVGVGSGMAMRGLRPIVEIMFGDFITLAFDQIVNHLAKFRMMYGQSVRSPLVIRTPMGGGRGYGPTHSQSLEKFLVGVPGLEVVAVSPVHNIEEFYTNAIIKSNEPTVIIENKAMYGRFCRRVVEGQMEDFACRVSSDLYPTITMSLNDFSRSDVTLITYGGMTESALNVAEEMLIEHEIFVEVIVLGQLSPVLLPDILESVSRSGRVVILEEGTARLGIGAEISSLIMENAWPVLRRPVKRVASADYIIPCAKVLEDHVLPGPADIESAIWFVMDKKSESLSSHHGVCLD